MASSLMFCIIFLIAAIGTTICSAKDIIVGDEAGWTLDFDYQAWAKGKDFRVGDKLIFRYHPGAHNVFRVNGTGFQYCINPPANEAMNTGYDTIVLTRPGRKWYICGVGNHCEKGLKLFIVVKPVEDKVPVAKGKEIIVGDEAGWRLGFDYQAWAKGKDFRVGDKLVFKYPVGAHNVFRVDGTGFQKCINPPANEALSSGNDTITLANPGRKWYICGVGKHCEHGMKLFMIVKSAETEPPSAVTPIRYLGKEFIVGDGAGWRLDFDYQAWAKGKDFRVGDKLVFQYHVGAHNVFRVNGTGFQFCIRPPVSEALNTGNDTIVLSTPGRKWYICGVGKHCEYGMKLFLTVKY